MDNFKLKIEDYILYILSHLEPEKSDFWRVNKIAFLVEFAYLYFNEKELSDAQYAAINYGPVINNYRDIFEKMVKKGLIKTQDHHIQLETTKKVGIPDEVASQINPLIKKYSDMTIGELKAITHSTDSYKITTQNEKVMGNIIDKKLANLETFYEDNGSPEGELKESELPTFDRKNLVKYEF